MTTKKKTTKRRSTSKRKTKAQLRAKRELSAIILFAVGLLLLFLSVIEGDNAWSALHNVLRGLFGWCSYLLGPIAIIVAAAMAADTDNTTPPGIKTTALFILVVIIAGLTQVIREMDPGGTFVETIKVLYVNGKELQGGGAMGIWFGTYPLRWMGRAGAIVVDIILIFVFFMISSGLTLSGLAKGAKKPVKKIEDAYTQSVENRAQRETKVPQNRRFNIDVPLDDNTKKTEPAKGKNPIDDLSAESEESIRKINKLTETLKFNGKGKMYDYESEADDTPHEPGKAPNDSYREASSSKENPPTIEDLITRATTGVVKVGDYKESSQDGMLHFGATPEERAAQVSEMNQAISENEIEKEYTMPPINLLEEPKRTTKGKSVEAEMKANAAHLVDTLHSFGVDAKIVDITRGSTVTRYELLPAAGVKISRITNLADDIALGLAAGTVRIEAPIPGKAAIGIEVPNKEPIPVPIRELITHPSFEKANSKLSVALGKDITGECILMDIEKMPHVLIGGTTGSGKSVCINSIITSILYRATPDEVKLLMVDPKIVELGIYNGIPHLLVPVVTDPKKAAGALCWACAEMDRRYQLLAAAGARNIASYNELAKNNPEIKKMPQIVIIIDELADLMMTSPKDVEDYICRLTQKARAAGIHLVVATQRPSADVVTGIIKSNIPSRIAFAVASQIDSRIILDGSGAEKLLSRGDMLYNPVGTTKPIRAQGCFVSDQEVERIVAFIKEGTKGEYDEQVLQEIEQSANRVKGKNNNGLSLNGETSENDSDELFEQAVAAVVEAGQASTSLLQRRLKVGYARAARLVDEMEEKGIVGPFEGSKPRRVLLTKEEYYERRALSSD